MTKFNVFVKELPATCMIDVRITDNVMDAEDWGIDQLYLEDSVVRFQDHVDLGIYTIPDMEGWTSEQLMEWSRHDDTGRHPENYHEIKVYAFKGGNVE